MGLTYLKIGSLFSGGLGGLELGLEAAGVGYTVWQCEIDPRARANLARHYPGAAQYTDVRTLDGRQLEPVDVVCGGFPCLGVSSAGKGLGLSDPRSGLWFEYARLISELRPRYVVVENTPHLPTRGLEGVLRSLAQLGYDAFWFHLRAETVGAPHRRRRIFLIAWLEAGPTATVADSDSYGRRVEWLGSLLDREWAALRDDADRRRCADRALETVLSQHHWPPGPDDVTAWAEYLVAHPTRAPAAVLALSQPQLNPVFVESLMGVPDGWTSGSRKRRLIHLGNGVVPQVALVVGHVLLGLDAKLRRLG